MSAKSDLVTLTEVEKMADMNSKEFIESLKDIEVSLEDLMIKCFDSYLVITRIEEFIKSLQITVSDVNLLQIDSLLELDGDSR